MLNYISRFEWVISACPVQAIEYGRASVGRPRNYLTRVPAQYAERKQDNT